MKKRIDRLAVWIVASAALFGLAGAYLKYVPMARLGLFQENSIFSVPFLLLADKGAQYALKMEGEAHPVVPVPTEAEPNPETLPTEPLETAAPTEPPAVELEESWFDDALFVGDSRMVGLQSYAPLGEAHYFCRTSMGVFTALDWYGLDDHYGNASLEQLLTTYDYGKIILSLGMNETGYEQDWVIKKYQEIIDLVKEKQPGTPIILELLMNVTKEKTVNPSFTPERMTEMNGRLTELALKNDLYLIDPNEWATDEEGFLREDLTRDGLHPTYDGYLQWSAWTLEICGSLGIPDRDND